MSESSSVGRREFLGFLGAGAVWLVGCSSDGNGGPGPAPPPPPPPPAPNADVVIDIRDFEFVVPGGGDSVTISVGTTVGWTNSGNVAHTATSTDIPAGGQAFDTGTINAGQSSSVVQVFSVAGTWTYRCEFHPAEMNGATIIVQ
jgi:plastocyanin